MTLEKLTSTDAFIVADLDGAPAAGIVRAAPKILVDGATLLARSLTYRFASFERRVSGASSGINAGPEARADALVAYVAEVESKVVAGLLMIEAGKGVTAEELAQLRVVDPRPDAYWELQSDLTGLGIAVAADAGCGGLDGRAVAIEGFDGAGPALARAVVERGGRVVAIATPSGTAISPDGFEPAALEAAWNDQGTQLVSAVAAEPGPASAIFAITADVLVVGSKPGIVDDQVASRIEAGVVVGGGPVPVTAKGLAVLRRAARVVVPDFLATAGPMFAGWPSPGGNDPSEAAAKDIASSVAEVLEHPDGPFLGACYRAERYLLSWRDELPFGRPLA